jgi:ZIP family zinc transporter
MKTFFNDFSPTMCALIATTFCWAATALGASLVFFVNTVNKKAFDTMLGFTGGVMMAASVFSLLNPAIAMSTETGMMRVMPTLIGFCLGGLFLWLLDKVIPHLHINNELYEAEGIKTDWHGTTLLVLAITLHNIPEGLAVGILFGGAAIGLEGTSFSAAITLAIGIAIQNFPEGAAVSLPLRRQGVSKSKSFFYGQLSAVVEPIAGVIGAIMVVQMNAILPYALAFAAGAMIYVIVEEVIPESQKNNYANSATLGFMFGFALMMVLDVGLA